MNRELFTKIVNLTEDQLSFLKRILIHYMDELDNFEHETEQLIEEKYHRRNN